MKSKISVVQGVIASVALILLSSCGVPNTNEFTKIADANIPFELNATTTSSSTTTTTLAPDLPMPGAGTGNIPP